MNEVLDSALSKLAALRPIFHSEADFQFALAWQIKLVDPDAAVRLEVPVTAGEKTYKLDLLFVQDGKRIGIELKLLRAPIILEHGGESFRLKDAAADLNRYDFLWDVMRLEYMIKNCVIDEGYALALSNHPTYWKPRTGKRTTDAFFGLEEGRVLAGELSWASHTGGTRKGREASIQLANITPFAGEITPQWRPENLGSLEHSALRFALTQTS